MNLPLLMSHIRLRSTKFKVSAITGEVGLLITNENYVWHHSPLIASKWCNVSIFQLKLKNRVLHGEILVAHEGCRIMLERYYEKPFKHTMKSSFAYQKQLACFCQRFGLKNYYIAYFYRAFVQSVSLSFYKSGPTFPPL